MFREMRSSAATSIRRNAKGLFFSPKASVAQKQVEMKKIPQKSIKFLARTAFLRNDDEGVTDSDLAFTMTTVCVHLLFK